MYQNSNISDASVENNYVVVNLNDNSIDNSSTNINILEGRFLFKLLIQEKISGNKCWQGSGEKGNQVHCWLKCKLVQLLWKTAWTFLKN